MTDPKQRFLLPKARVGDGLGYTDKPELAMRDEPECLDEADWNRYIGKPAAQSENAEKLARERDLRLLSQEERIVKAQREAAAKRRDVSREVWMLRRMQQKQRTPEVIEKRVQALERVVYLGRAA